MRPKTFIAGEHDIDHAHIDADALWVIKKLQEAGHTAYLVGGSVRDLLIKIHPKDFDISTSARPEEIKDIFRRQCILIGRRFRLAHIRFGHKVIEVSTFRSGDNESDLIIRDNQWGTEEEDVTRRDFTINGLYYDPTTHTIIDYVGGWEDIHKRLLRSIGDPMVRFKQDPVRMIRLLKFRARIEFEIDPESKNALLQCKDELVKSSPARILEEFFRMLESGAAKPFFRMMHATGLLKLIFPSLSTFLGSSVGKTIYQYLAFADKIHQNRGGIKLERAVLTACLLFPILEREIKNQYTDQGITPTMGHVMNASQTLIKMVVSSSFAHFPKAMSGAMGYVMQAQYKFTPPSGKRHYRSSLFHHKEFQMALKFLKLRSLVDESLFECYTTWTKAYRHYQSGDEQKGHHNPAPIRREAETGS